MLPVPMLLAGQGKARGPVTACTLARQTALMCLSPLHAYVRAAPVTTKKGPPQPYKAHDSPLPKGPSVRLRGHDLQWQRITMANGSLSRSTPPANGRVIVIAPQED
ncbi:hypothetical protein SRHO_G00041130 [Serrasalmus rhombeus]